MAKSSAWLPPIMLLGLAAAGLATPAPDTKNTTAIHFLPGGVADADGGRAL